MEISTEIDGDVVIVKSKGRFYSSVANDAEESFVAALGSGTPRLVIDMMELDYISSAGPRVLLRLARRVQRANGKVVLFGLHPNVREVFSITAFDTLFSIHADRDAAVAAVR